MPQEWPVEENLFTLFGCNTLFFMVLEEVALVPIKPGTSLQTPEHAHTLSIYQTYTLRQACLIHQPGNPQPTPGFLPLPPNRGIPEESHRCGHASAPLRPIPRSGGRSARFAAPYVSRHRIRPTHTKLEVFGLPVRVFHATASSSSRVWPTIAIPAPGPFPHQLPHFAPGRHPRHPCATLSPHRVPLRRHSRASPPFVARATNPRKSETSAGGSPHHLKCNIQRSCSCMARACRDTPHNPQVPA
jgi:hypothetical protein